jgi:hypothetical protein
MLYSAAWIQALELQRRDEILHAMQSRLQSSGQNIVDFLTPLPETAEVTKVHDSSSRPVTVGSDGTLTAPPTPTLQQSEKLHDATVRAQRHFKGAPYAVADWGARTGFGREQPGMHDRSRPVSRDLRIPTPGGTAVSGDSLSFAIPTLALSPPSLCSALSHLSRFRSSPARLRSTLTHTEANSGFPCTLDTVVFTAARPPPPPQHPDRLPSS